MSPREAFPPAPEGDDFSLDSVEETGIEAEEDTRTISSTSSNSSDWLKDELRSFFQDIADALQTPRSELPNDSSRTESLSLLSLQKDLKRCYNLLHPVIEVAAAFYDILMWNDAFSTLPFALVFFYSVYRQWTATLILLLLSLQFGLNYLATKKGIKIGLYFLPRKNLPKPSFNLSGAQLVIEVAKIVQYLLRFSVDVLEKIYSLFTWKEERVTLRFCYLLAYWLGWALLFDLGTCLSWCVAALGVRLFFTTYLFERFPLLRNSLDTYGYFYRNLPVKNQPPSPDLSYVDLTSFSSSSSISSQQSSKSRSRFRLWAQSKLRRISKST